MELTERMAVAINRREAAKDQQFHERNIAAFNSALLVHDRIHQRAMAFAQSDGQISRLESYCVGPDEAALFRAACRVLTRLMGANGSNINETAE